MPFALNRPADYCQGHLRRYGGRAGAETHRKHPSPPSPCYGTTQAVHSKILSAYQQRDEANGLFAEADALLHETLGVSPFSEEDIEYFSGCAAPRSPSFRWGRCVKRSSSRRPKIRTPKPVHTPRQLSPSPQPTPKKPLPLAPPQSAHLFRPPAVLGLGRVTQLTRQFGRAAQPASVTRLCLIGVYPCSSAAKLPLPAPLNPLSRPKLALFGRKGNYGYSQSDTG